MHEERIRAIIMDINKFLSKLFGNKSTRDMKLIQPWVEKIKAAYPAIQALDNDALRAKTKELQHTIQHSADDIKEKIEELKGKVEETPIEDREVIFSQIDKLETQVLDRMEVALNDALPEVFAIVKDTARRFAENETIEVTANDFDRELAASHDFVTIEGDKAIYQNHWVAGGNDTKWNMVHYDVQLFGGVVLHQGKIAEMATGEGKTLVGTLPVFLNALTGNGVHVVTVNDYLAKRDSEWMGPLYMFHGLSVDCIDKHQPNSESRRRAYQADITFGTNNEFGFDYLRDNMAMSPKDLVQRRHNYAIVDEVDSVLIDDARTPLIISGPVPKGDDQLFEQYQPLVQHLVEVQRKLATQYLAEAKQLIKSGDKNRKKKVSLPCSAATRLCLRTIRSLSSSLKLVSKLVCSRLRKSIWRTTTAVCPRLLNLFTLLWTRKCTVSTLPTRVTNGWPTRCMTTSSLCCPTSLPNFHSSRQTRH